MAKIQGRLNFIGWWFNGMRLSPQPTTNATWSTMRKWPTSFQMRIRPRQCAICWKILLKMVSKVSKRILIEEKTHLAEFLKTGNGNSSRASSTLETLNLYNEVYKFSEGCASDDVPCLTKVWLYSCSRSEYYFRTLVPKGLVPSGPTIRNTIQVQLLPSSIWSAASM